MRPRVATRKSRMPCKQHPSYKGIKPPQVECKTCWTIWYAKAMKEGKKWWLQATGEEVV